MPEAVSTIDRLSTTPYYQQLCEALGRQIGTSAYPTGTRLPSEHELCTEFGLSRATVRQALQTLERKGVVERVPGRGVFVRKPELSHGWVIQGVEGFLENAVGHQNRSVSTKVLRSGSITLPGFATRAFDIPEGSIGYELVRLRKLDGVPALFSINYSPPALIPVIDKANDVLDGRASFSALHASAGYELGGANRTIIAAAAPKEVAAGLGIRRTEPVLHIRSISWVRDGACFDVYDTWVRSDVVPLEVNVTVPLGAR